MHIASRCTYGVPRIHAELRRLDRRVNRKRVERIMRERDITGVTRRKRRSLTRPAKKAVPAHDLIGRDFTAEAPGTRLGGDITYIPTDEGWLYLATWLDLATREIVGYSMADHHRASLVVDALTMAAGRGRLQTGCIVYSDRGAEYTSDELRREISRLGLRQSMGRTGSCYDNAAAESSACGAPWRSPSQSAAHGRWCGDGSPPASRRHRSGAPGSSSPSHPPSTPPGI
ncbi:IS3 family transposase [Streptomyces sp. NPDC001868]|uniref:IS3 family transposase n=1 Tax=Streptomyces sp. NPDC001868 TaxID=3154401 RepID=UPI00332AFF3F